MSRRSVRMSHFFAALLGAAVLLTSSSEDRGSAWAQASSSSATDSSQSAAKNEFDGVYRIKILAHYYNLYRDTRRYTASGILFKEPNLFLTTKLYDEDGDLLYVSPGTIIGICEQQPDPVIVAAKARELEEKFKDNKIEQERFAEIKPKTGEKGTKGAEKSKEKEDAKTRNTAHSQDLAELEYCIRATVKKVDADRPLVLLESIERFKGSVPTFNVSDPEVGTSVKAYGFPLDADKFPTRRSSEKERLAMLYVPTVTFGTVVKTNTDKQDGQMILHQAPVSSGAWGGPILNLCNDVIGLNVAQNAEWAIRQTGKSKTTGSNSGQAEVAKVRVPTSNVSAAVGALELRTFAELNGITLPKVNSKPCLVTASIFDFQRSPWAMWTLAIGGSSLLLAASALVIALRRPGPVRNTVARIFPGVARSTTAAGYAGDYRSGAGYTGGTTGNVDYAPYPAIGAATPVETLTTTPPPAATPANASGAGAGPTRAMAADLSSAVSDSAVRLVPVGGGLPVALDTQRLGSGGITIGRDSDCEIVTDNATVSKRHARLTRMPNGRLQVEDLGSANGTWRGKGRVQRESFANGEVVRFGSLEYRIEMSNKGGNGGDPTVMMAPPRNWLLSGFDEEGRVVQLPLQPKVDAMGRQIETSWVVGRNAERVDRLLADKRVSSEHARIRFTPQRGLEICDLGSSNGTKVDGRKVADSYMAIDEAKVVEFGGIKMSLGTG